MKFKIKFSLIIIGYLLIFYLGYLIDKQDILGDKRECFESCYIMTMDTCEKLDEETCGKFDELSRMYCCKECKYKTDEWWETYSIIKKEDI